MPTREPVCSTVGKFLQKPASPEPHLQSKRRVEPKFTKAPEKSSAEPQLQSKRRVEPEFIKSTEKSFEGGVVLQSKKRVSSPVTGILSEPAIQSKKRSEGPRVTLTNGFFDNALYYDEFALLGNQDKFSENVKYKLRENLKPRDVSPPKQMKLQKKYKENKAPQPAPVVNTEQFKKPETPLAPRKPKEQSAPIIEEVKKQQEEVKKQQEKELKQQKIRQAENLNREELMKDSMKNKRIDVMNEFAQTNIDKGVTDSAAEAPADYALKYKTGISAPRVTKKVSEYQKQFDWKVGNRPSPLIGAEQVIYNNNVQLSPPKKDVIPKVTEYQKQFKPFKLVPVPTKEPETPQKKTKLQRSKSLEGLSPTEIPAAGSAPVIAPDNKRLTLESDQRKPISEPMPKVPKRKSRVYRSEYLSNFQAPDRYDYLKGAWLGAHPPHVRAQKPEEKSEKSGLSNWFAEVLELRRKAKEYQLRAQGTHFSREHLVQLIAQNAELWDASTVSTARSDRTLSALSLESGASSHRDSRSPKALKEVIVGMPGEGNFRHSDTTLATMATEDDHTLEEEIDRNRLVTPSTDDGQDDDGRIPGPNLRKQLQQEGNQRRRHHLDRTTPTVDGAVLSSSPQQKRRSGRKKFVSKSVDSISQATLEEEKLDDVESVEKPAHQPLAGQKTYTVNSGFLSTTPTFGLPSRDTHFLRDDDASTDRPLVTQFVNSPQRHRTPGGLDAIDEGYGQTYSKPVPEVPQQPRLAWTIDGGMTVPRRSDDVLSVSTRSIASSCSLASETLERARRRKEEFWGKSGIATR